MVINTCKNIHILKQLISLYKSNGINIVPLLALNLFFYNLSKGAIMKYYLLIPILAIFILAGCAKENSILEPQTSQIQTNRQWLKINQSSTLSVENTYTVTKSIDGNKGGSIALVQSFINDGKQASFSANLTIPKHAFKGTLNISYTVNTETASIEFSPTTPGFNRDLSLDLIFTGIDISKNKTSDLRFSYLDGDNIIPVESAYVKVDVNQGILEVLGAQISHFSRYGWSTLDDQE